jgi:hypothetical protein
VRAFLGLLGLGVLVSAGVVAIVALVVLALLEGLGHTTREQHGREVKLKIDLREAQAAARVRPLLREFATGGLAPGRALLERLWPRRRAALGDPART